MVLFKWYEILKGQRPGRLSKVRFPNFLISPNFTTIMDKSVDIFEQNKRFQSASFRNWKKHLFVEPNSPLPFSMLKCAPCTLSQGYNIEKGEGVEKIKLEIEKLTRSTKPVFFGECLNCFYP